MNVHATIADRAVDLTDWQADSTVNWGYRSLSGRIPESVTWAEQEAPVRLWTPDSAELWAGKLSLDPETQRGTRSIKAEGYAQDIQAATTRMFYRIDGGGAWVVADSDPHNYDNSEKFEVDTGGGRLVWHLGDGTTVYSNGNQAAVVLWMEGALVTRYSVLTTSSGNFGALDLQSLGATGPSGTRTVEGTHSLSILGTPTTYARTLTTPVDLLCFRVIGNATGPVTPAQKHRILLTTIRVYGRTTDNAYSASEVVADVGADAGFDTTGVQSNSLAVLPIDWTEEHPGLLDYIAELTDWHWEALGPEDGVPKLAFGPYETTWTAYQSHGVRPNWEPMKRYNGVKVPYTSVSGRSLSVTVMADPDPFPGKTVIYPAEPLEDPQPDATLATAVATAQAPYWSSPRAAGRIEIGRVSDDHGAPADGYKVRPGHLINVAERADLGPQRVVAVTYRERGVTADVGRDFSVIRLLSDLQRQGRKRRKGRR